MLRGLSRSDREILARIDVDGGSQASIARELGVSPSAIKSRVQRARARPRRRLEACCSVEKDARGAPFALARRPGSTCPCPG